MDIGLFLNGEEADIKVIRGDLSLDDTLETAVMISLFTDRRVEIAELGPGETDQRGWWGDKTLDDPNDFTGSKLWLLQREKVTNSTLLKAQDYAREALQWMIDDGVASKVEVVAEWYEVSILGVKVNIQRPDGTSEFYRYSTNWKSQKVKRG